MTFKHGKLQVFWSARGGELQTVALFDLVPPLKKGAPVLSFSGRKIAIDLEAVLGRESGAAKRSGQVQFSVDFGPPDAGVLLTNNPSRKAPKGSKRSRS